MSQVDLLAPPDAEAIARSLDLFVASLRERYGDALKGVYLFGSRARGDFEPFSDTDVAVVVDDTIDETRQTVPLSGTAYDILLETGSEIQPWVFQERDWSHPEQSTAPGFIRSAKKDGRKVWEPG
jgi:predicted nucleotidyltransferase